MAKIFVGVPSYGRMVYADTLSSLYELGVTLGKNDLFGGFGMLDYNGIGLVRNMFATAFMDRTNATHLLMIDADMRFGASLIADMMDLDKPVVGVIYHKRAFEAGWVGVKLKDEKPEGGFLKVSGVGAGVLLIKRECFEMMEKHFPFLEASEHGTSAKLTRLATFFDPAVVNGKTLSEDLSFCHRWRSIGGDVYANVSHDIGHIGTYDFHGCFQNDLNALVATE